MLMGISFWVDLHFWSLPLTIGVNCWDRDRIFVLGILCFNFGCTWGEQDEKSNV